MLHLHLLLLLAASTCSPGVRVDLSDDMSTDVETPKAQTKTFKCVVKTQGTWNLEISFPIRAKKQSKARSQCTIYTNRGKKTVFMPDGQFPLVFDPTHDPDDTDIYGKSKHGSCVCKVSGQPRTKFRLYSQLSREQCEESLFAAREQCWDSYKRMTGMEVERLGEIVTWMMGSGGIRGERNFVVDNRCPECDGAACFSVTIPSYVSTITPEDRAALFTTLTSNKAQGNDRIEDVLPEEELEKLRFTKYDVNNNGKLNMEELHNMYNSDGHSVPNEELKEAVNEFDQNANGEIRFDQFDKFQDVLRGIKKRKQKAEEDSAARLNDSRHAAQVQPTLTVNTAADSTNRPTRAKTPVPQTPQTSLGPLTAATLRNTRCCCAKVGGQVQAARVIISLAVGSAGWLRNGTEESQACPTISSLKPLFVHPDTKSSMCVCTTNNMVWKSGTKCGGLRGSIDSKRETVETHHLDVGTDEEDTQCQKACLDPATTVVRQECLD